MCISIYNTYTYGLSILVRKLVNFNVRKMLQGRWHNLLHKPDMAVSEMCLILFNTIQQWLNSHGILWWLTRLYSGPFPDKDQAHESSAAFPQQWKPSLWARVSFHNEKYHQWKLSFNASEISFSQLSSLNNIKQASSTVSSFKFSSHASCEDFLPGSRPRRSAKKSLMSQTWKTLGRPNTGLPHVDRTTKID